MPHIFKSWRLIFFKRAWRAQLLSSSSWQSLKMQRGFLVIFLFLDAHKIENKKLGEKERILTKQQKTNKKGSMSHARLKWSCAALCLAFVKGCYSYCFLSSFCPSLELLYFWITWKYFTINSYSSFHQWTDIKMLIPHTYFFCSFSMIV